MVRLAQIQEEHFPLIREWALREDLAEYFRRFPQLFVWSSSETMKQYFQNTYAILDEDTVIGLIQLFSFDSQNRKAELGILVDKNRCKNRARVAYEASHQLCDYLFNYLSYHKVFCLVLTHRKDIAKLLSTFKFKNEGTLRDNVFWQGKFQDEVVFGLTADEFRRIK